MPQGHRDSMNATLGRLGPTAHRDAVQQTVAWYWSR
jgi:hypothetical protein